MKKNIQLIHCGALNRDVASFLRATGLIQAIESGGFTVSTSGTPTKATEPTLWDEKNENVPASATTYGALAAFFCTGLALGKKTQKIAFCPDFKNASSSLQKQMYALLSKEIPTLFVAHEKEDLKLGAIPGLQTLFSPYAIQFHLRALVSGAAVFTFRTEAALIAVRNKVPAVLFVDSPKMQEVAEHFQIPFVNVGADKPIAKCIEAALQIVHSYPWEKVTSRCVLLAKEFLHTLEKLGIKTAYSFENARPSHLMLEKEPVRLCSISDSNYLPFLEGFIENAAEREGGGVQFFILDLDGKVGPRLKERFPHLSIESLLLSDLWNAQELPSILTRGIGFRAFSTKPRLIEYALKKTQGKVFYCDSDVYFFDKPSALLHTFESGNFVVFPHWNDEFPAARLDGLYNAGMIGVRPGAEKILHWWSSQTLAHCKFDHAGGHVGDQSYLDFVPVYFKEANIYRGKDHNVARWNLKTLGVQWQMGNAMPLLMNGVTVKTFHAAFLDEMGVFEVKNTWDQLLAWFSDKTQSTAALNENIEKQQRRHWLALSRALKLKEATAFIPVLKNISHENWIQFFVCGAGGAVLSALLEAKTQTPDSIPASHTSASNAQDWAHNQNAYLFQSEKTGLKEHRG